MNRITRLLISNDARIFISYRRDDSKTHTDRLSEGLSQHFGKQWIFLDTGSIKAGEEFARVINNEVLSSKVMLAVIGKQWLRSMNDKGVRRLDEPDDFVRLEIAKALENKIPVIPVLVQGAPPPAEKDLPDELKPLAQRQAFAVSDSHWEYDVGQLINRLEEILPKRALLSPKSFVAITCILVLLTGAGIFAYRNWQSELSANNSNNPTQNRPVNQNVSQIKPETPLKVDGICVYQKRDLTYALDNVRLAYQPFIHEAIKVWDEASGLNFKEVSDVQSADLKFSWKQGNHGDLAPFDKESPAHAFFAPPCGNPFAGQIHFNDDIQWSLQPGQAGIPLKAHVLHTIGIALGLGKSLSPDSVMSTMPKVNSLSNEDVHRVQSIYGPP